MNKGERYIIQPDHTNSSEYQILDVVNQSIVANGLSVEDAREAKENWNKEWLAQIDKLYDR